MRAPAGMQPRVDPPGKRYSLEAPARIAPERVSDAPGHFLWTVTMCYIDERLVSGERFLKRMQKLLAIKTSAGFTEAEVETAMKFDAKDVDPFQSATS